MTMQSTASTWEKHLYALSQFSPGTVNVAPILDDRQQQERTLAESFAVCEAITAEHSRSFYLASGLLPREKRRAMRVLYAFCRTADNLADGNIDQPAEKLLELRKALTGQYSYAGDPVLTGWSYIHAQYKIPSYYAEQLLDGVGRDLMQRRYRTFEELSIYCYCVASTVGLMSMHITGFSDQRAIPSAIKLGVALQLTNILRDVWEDWNAGRLYLPLEELAAFGLNEDDIASARLDDRWRDFMRFQIARTRLLYAEAMPGIALLDADGRFAVAAAAVLYRGILDDIEAHDYNVFHYRAHVNPWRKLVLLQKAFGYSKKTQSNFLISED